MSEKEGLEETRFRIHKLKQKDALTAANIQPRSHNQSLFKRHNFKTCSPSLPRGKFFIFTVIFVKASRYANKYFKRQGANSVAVNRVYIYFVSALKTFGDIFVAEQLPLSRFGC
jgi:hypothetical protein